MERGWEAQRESRYAKIEETFKAEATAARETIGKLLDELQEDVKQERYEARRALEPKPEEAQAVAVRRDAVRRELAQLRRADTGALDPGEILARY